MSELNKSLVENVRKLLTDYKPDEFTFSKLAKDLGQPVETLIKAFGNESGLVDEILAYEQQNLESVFTDFDYNNMNAIDGLLQVSRVISQRFGNILPSINFDLRQLFPEARQKFVEKRVGFVNAKIKLNFEEGMEQGLYRPDLSSEMVARIYISRLLDMHNPDFFPNESISFNVLFDVMFETFILGICTEAGRDYYNKQIKHLKFS